MKKLIFLIIAVFSFGLEINFASGILMKSSLKNRFVNYWNYRAHKEFYKTYKFELPYLKYIHPKEEYEDFFNDAPRIKKVMVKHLECKDNICYVGMVLKIGREYVYYKDKWIKVDNIWYHRFKDSALPR